MATGMRHVTTCDLCGKQQEYGNGWTRTDNSTVCIKKRSSVTRCGQSVELSANMRVEVADNCGRPVHDVCPDCYLTVEQLFFGEK